LASAEISAGPVFRHVALGDKVSAAPLSTDAIARVVRKHAHRLGLDPRRRRRVAEALNIFAFCSERDNGIERTAPK
jgi:hypothetical protein